MRRAVLSLLLLPVLAGCRSPEAYREEADGAAYGIIAAAQRDTLGEARDFTLTRPSDRLRRRLAMAPAPGGDASVPAGAPRLSLVDALQVGARNSRVYQSRKEEVFAAALALDLERDAFRSSYAGLLSGGAASDGSGGSRSDRVEGGAAFDVTRTLKTGATLAGRLSLDVVKLLTGDRTTSFGLILDTTVTIPLMRGAGREIVTEPLTQAERNVAYALLEFERFRKTFAVDRAGEYLAVLQVMQEGRNAEANLARLSRNLARSEKLAEAGRLPEIQVDQTRQEVLRARNRVIAARRRVDSGLDAFKLSLGLPVDAEIALEPSALERLSAEALPAAPAAPADAATVTLALEQRMDLRVVRGRREDARRQVRVAAHALKAGLTLTASTDNRARREEGGDTDDITFGDGTYRLGADLDLPWERTAERNAYRNALIAADRAARDVEAAEDGITRDVREALRLLRETRQACAIQAEAVTLAERRVASTALFLEAGRAEVRDVLDSEEDLLAAQNALTDALAAYRRARWELARDTGSLAVDDGALWE